MLNQFKILKFIIYGVSILFYISLSGCTVGPMQLGLSPDQWQALTPAEQQQALQTYHTIHSNLVNQTKASQPLPEQDQGSMTLLPMIQNAPTIQITIVSGLATFPPNFNPPMPIQPLSFSMIPGGCALETIQSLSTDNNTTLWVCYKNNLVSIDPSMLHLANAWGTLYIDINPLWHEGISYTQLQTHGYTHLTQATIHIIASTPFQFNRPTPDDAIPFESTQTQHTMKRPNINRLPIPKTTPQPHLNKPIQEPS